MSRTRISVVAVALLLSSLPALAVTLEGVAVKGELSVGASGAASYSVPIMLPKGPGSFTPGLSLVYSSQKGNDFVGQGWSIGGLSTVSRCPLTIAQDGRNRSVAFDDQDALCLDGARLVLVKNGAGITGYSQKEYATEIESFSRVVAYIPTGKTAPEYFQVWRKNGVIDTYGATTDSRVEVAAGSTVVKEWRLNHREDRRGNYLDFGYSEDLTNGEVTPSFLEYGANQSASQPHLYRVSFVAESRTDKLLTYQLGYKSSRLNRLKAISISRIANGVVGAAFRTYSLGYQYSQSTGASRLSSLTLCAKEGAVEECMPATTFAWHELPSSFASPVSGGMPPYSTTLATNTMYTTVGAYRGGMVVDLDNNGRPDYLHSSGAEGKNIFMLSQPGVQFSTESPNGAASYVNNSAGKDGGLRVTDINHDGYVDLVEIVNGAISVRCGKKDASGFQFSPCTSIPAGQTAAQAFLAIDGDFAVQGKDNGIRLADINDDGIDDIIVLRKKSSVSYRKVYLGSYRTDIPAGGKYYYWYESAALSAALPQNAYFVIEDKDGGLRIFDIDGNGRPDLVASDNGTKVVYLNQWAPSETDSRTSPSKQIQGASFVSDSTRAAALPLSFISGVKGDAGVRFVDLNGDGLTDILRCQSDLGGVVRNVFINTGSGFLPNDSVFANSINFDVNLMGVDGGARFADVNGDGLVDVVESTYIMASGTNYPKKNVYLNDGTKFYRSTQYSNSLSNLYAQLNGGDSTASFYWLATGAELIDIDADGYVDLVQMNSMGATGTGAPYPYPANSNQRRYQRQNRADGVANDKLASICDGLNHCSAIKYSPLTDSSVYTPGFDASRPKLNVNGPVYVVSSIEEGADNGSANPRLIQYQYKSMVSSTEGRGSLGFAEQTITVKSPNPVTEQYEVKTTTTTQFSQDWPYVGSPVSTTTKAGNSGVTVSQVDSIYGLKICSSGSYDCAEMEQTVVSLQDNTTRYLPYLKQSTEQTSGYPIGGLLSTSITTTSLSPFGSVDLQVTQVSQGLNVFTATTDPEYAVADTGKWLLDQKTRVTQTHVQPDFDGDEDNDSLARTIDFNYYPASTSNNFEGLLKQKITEPGDPSGKLKNITELGYDVYGNITSTKLMGTTASLLIDRLTQQAYTNANGRYPTSVTNAKGHTEVRDVHADLGVPNQVIDANNIKSSWTYDLFGRDKTHTGFDDIDTPSVEGLTVSTGYSACASGCLPNTQYIKTVTAPSQPEVVTYYDSSNRVVGTRVKLLDGSYSYTEQAYNADGLLLKTSRPYFEGQKKYWTSYEYDALGRPARVTDARGYSTVYSYNGYETVATNPKQQVRKEKKNALDQLVQVTDDSAKSISYAYDAFGSLSLTRDSKGNEIKIKYDLLGRKTEMRDPDLGLWLYDYNAFGELVSQKDARNLTTTLEYDTLGRLKTKSAADAVSNWAYDELIVDGVATAVPNGKGRLISATAANGYRRDYARFQNGAVVGGYNSFGNALQATTTIDNAPYTLSYDYDNSGRLVALHYPGGVNYKNVYTNGYLNKVTDSSGSIVYWEAKKLAADGKVTEELLGNGLTTQRIFKPETGLADSIRTGIKGANGLSATVQNEYYDYDALSNLWFRYDGVAGVSEIFGYDNLNRLTSAQVDGLAEVSASYDEIGNIVSKSDVGALYSYSPSGAGSVRPHAVTGISGGPISASFTYDDNGNMLTGNSRSYVDAQGEAGWSSFNKPISILTGNVTETFLYDAEYERAKRTTTVDNGGGNTSSSSIIYLNPRLDLGGTYERETKADTTVEQTYHLYAGSKVIGAVVVTGGATPTTVIRYFHADNLGSIAATTAASGVVLERLSYDAWGKRRLLTSSQTALGGNASVQLPAAASDPNKLITRDGGSGYITFKTNGIRNSQPFALGENVSAQLQHTVQAVLQVGANSGDRRNFEFAVENAATAGVANYRKYGVLMKGSSLYRRNCIGVSPCTDVLLGALSDNTQYTVNITTTGLAAQLSVQQQGVSGSFAHAMTIDWGAGVGGMQKHVVAGLGYKIRSLVVPVIMRWRNAPVVMQSLTQGAVTPQDGSIVAATTRHGYTGHEMLDNLQLVHMNGRIYDPFVARMLSPDPTVTEEKDQQSLNRYSYVRNAPLNYTDPSGFTEEPTGVLSGIMRLFGLGASPGAATGPAAGTGGSLIGGKPVAAGGAPSGFTTPQGTEQSSSALGNWGGGSPVDHLGMLNEQMGAQGGLAGLAWAFTFEDPINAVVAVSDGDYSEAGISGAKALLKPLKILSKMRAADKISEKSKDALKADGAVAKSEGPLIKAGSAGGETAGRPFPQSVKDAAKAENPTATCVYCRIEGTGTQIDHAIPRARGGNATLDNAQLACPHCNASKGAGDFPKTPSAGYVGPWPPTHW